MWMWKNRGKSLRVLTRPRAPNLDAEGGADKKSAVDTSPKTERLYEFITAVSRLGLIMAYVFLCDR